MLKDTGFFAEVIKMLKFDCDDDLHKPWNILETIGLYPLKG